MGYIADLLDRAAHHIVAAPPTTKLIERLSKGGKGTLDIAVVEMVLPKLGWTIENSVAPAMVKDEYVAASVLGPSVLIPLGVDRRNTRESKFNANFYGNSNTFYPNTPDEAAAKAACAEFVEKFLSLVTIVDKKPTPPFEMGRVYATKPVRETSGTPRVEVQYIWVGTTAFKLTAPDGEQVTLAVPLGEKPHEFQLASFWTFLYDHGAKEAAIKAIEGGDVTIPAKRPAGFKGKSDNIGTCPVCRNVQVIHSPSKHRPKLPGMVLHGYQRPGYGYIIGQCPGIQWPPWELSPDGLNNFVEMYLKPFIADTEQELVRTKAAKIFKVLYEDPAKQKKHFIHEMFLYEVDQSGGLMQLSDDPVPKTEQRGLIKIDRYSKPDFTQIKKKLVAGVTQTLENAKKDLDESEKALKSWKSAPLPGIQFQKEDEEQKKFDEENMCPGSGKQLETGTAPNGRKLDDSYSRHGALCSVCKKWVGPSSVRQYRGNGIAKKHRKDL